MRFDLPLDQLQSYCPPRDEPADFDAFWAHTLAEARRFPLNARFEAVETGLALIEAFDLTFGGYGGQPVKGWLLLPRQRTRSLPCVVEYLDYGRGRGHPADWLLWCSAGYAHCIMDNRGQGSVALPGDTPDPEPDGSNPQYPGFMTRGILDPWTYFYRRLFADAARAVEAARTHPAVDGQRVAVSGSGQGGGLALAAAGLLPDVAAALIDAPLLCHYRAAVEITDALPYQEIVRYCQVHRDKVQAVFSTLAYFDGLNFAARARAEATFSAALLDEVSPPHTVFAAYNHYAGPKQLRVWPYNRHEGGGTFQSMENLRFLARLWG